jgi:hypothetical protein
VTDNFNEDTLQNDVKQPIEQPSERRSFFWPAFVLALTLWVLASCGGLAAVVGLDTFSLADFQSIGPVWTPPPLVTATVAEQPAEQTAGGEGEVADSTRFQPGGRAQNITGSRVNIRRDPGHLGKPPEDVVAQLSPGDNVEILGWPRNADNLVWWPIRFGTVEGWVAESTGAGVQILAPLP